tara:strand:+ start:23 stop:667 length:645 start_codon:yes stop_codon:yes gene_type:complete
MDEDLAIINNNTRKEKLQNFLNDNKKRIFIFFLTIILIIFISFGYKEFQERVKTDTSNLYNKVIIEYNQDNKINTRDILVEIINKKDPTYSPLALYFIIDNGLISERLEINNLFDVLIQKTSLEKEIKNLIIYKKGLYNADYEDENELLMILGPLINTESVWKSHALYLMAEYFYSKKEMSKSKEFYTQIINLDDANQDLKKASYKRLNRDLSD